MNFRDTKDIVIIGAVLVGGYFLYTNFAKLKEKANPFSDKNAAYLTAEEIAKMIAGEKATVTDVIPGINNYDPNVAAKLTDKASALPNAAAPYWYNKDGTKRNSPTGLLGTAYDYNHKLIQIIDKATQRAVFV